MEKEKWYHDPGNWILIVGVLLIALCIYGIVSNQKTIEEPPKQEHIEDDTTIMPNFGQGGGVQMGGIVIY